MDLIPFKQFLKQRSSLCKYKHSDKTTCAFCAPPPLPSYAAKQNCNRGHAPYPQGVCLACAPSNCILKSQNYRHCDIVSVEAKIIMMFYGAWTKRGVSNAKNERAAILFGKYIDDSAETRNEGALRASVHCYYEPPQDAIPGGVRFNKDANEKTVHQIAQRLGLEPCGWMLVVPQRPSGDKYKGKVILSAVEIQQAARLQNRYKDENGYSRFVTVIIEHGTQVEPVAYQVSDICQSAERDGVLQTSPTDPYMLATKAAGKGQQVSSVVYRDKVLEGGVEYLADDFIVKVILSAPKTTETIFSNFDFPSSGKDEMIRFYLSSHAKDDYTAKFSDFNLLNALVPFIGLPLVYDICDAIKDRKQISPTLKTNIDNALKNAKLI